MGENDFMIAIWGAGNIGKKVYWKLKIDGKNVVTFYDNDMTKWNKRIDNVQIKKYKGESNFIIIATIYWKEIASILESTGKKLMKDFVPYWILDDEVIYEELVKLYPHKRIDEYFSFVKKRKKFAIIYGNCQTSVLKNMLLFHPEFRKDYTIITIPIVPAYKNEEQIECIMDSESLWKEIDLFIYQKVKLDNKFSERLSTEKLLPKLRADCLKISISSIYFKGYFIQYHPAVGLDVEDYLDDLFPFGDKYIDDYMSEKRSIEEIENFIECICKDDFLSKVEIKKECVRSIQELKRRERFVDVKICDYIEKFYQKRQLFYSINHPDSLLLYEYANRILEYMKYKRLPEISVTDLFLLFDGLKGGDMVIYPSVIHALEMEQWEKMYFPNRGVMANLLLDFKEYQKRYIEHRYMK